MRGRPARWNWQAGRGTGLHRWRTGSRKTRCGPDSGIRPTTIASRIISAVLSLIHAERSMKLNRIPMTRSTPKVQANMLGRCLRTICSQRCSSTKWSEAKAAPPTLQDLEHRKARKSTPRQKTASPSASPPSSRRPSSRAAMNITTPKNINILVLPKCLPSL